MTRSSAITAVGVNTLFLLATVIVQPVFAEFVFVHPGLLHTRADLERMKMAVTTKQEPVFAGYEVFRSHSLSQSNYAMHGPLATVGRNPTVGQSTYDLDAGAAYQCAVMWCITGDIAYASKAKEIINAWSSTLKSITGVDAVLMAGLGPFKMVNAAEIIRHTDAGWAEADIQKTERHFKEVSYPVLKDFAPFANGNWDAAAIKTVMAIGVFCDDREMFERALRYYVNGAGNGRLTQYIINEAGQCQESGRDMGHTQLGLAHLGDGCEIAWSQGLNLYAYADNRLLKGFEYTARYILGENVPFSETLDRTGKYHHTAISIRNRGRLRPVFEQIYNHYINRMQMSATFTQKAAERIRPEGPSRPGGDHPGFGTLFFTRPPAPAEKVRSTAPPTSPGAIIARGSPKAIKLDWVAPVEATSYTIKRATRSSGPFSAIATNIASASYTDTNVKEGEVYYYVVSASNSAGESPDAFEASVSVGLPSPWRQQDVGHVKIAGSTEYDGKQFIVEGAGVNIGGTNDQFQFAYAPTASDCIITARYVPQVSSQFTRMGLMMRETLSADAANVSLLLSPESSGDWERPHWVVRLASREAAGTNSTTSKSSHNLSTPQVINGRLMGHVWLRLQRAGNPFTGSMSSDGRTWTQVGSVTNSLKRDLLVGLPVCSGVTKVATTVRFDNVTFDERKMK